MLNKLLLYWRGNAPVSTTQAGPGAANSLTAQGLAAFQSGDHQRAETAFRAAYAADSNNPVYAFHLASALCGLGRVGEAAPLAWQAFSQTPSDSNFMGCMKYITCNLGLTGDSAVGAAPWNQVAAGNALRNQGQFEEAETAYRAALTAMPENLFLLGRVGAILCNQGRFAESAPYFRAASAAGLMPDGMLNFDAARLARLAQSAAWKRASAPVLPALRHAARGEFVFLLSCDSVYFERYAAALVNSVGRNAGIECTMHFHVINPVARVFEIAQSLATRHARVDLVLTQEAADTAAQTTPKLLYACARFILLPALMDHYRKPVFVLDMDALVMRNLSGLLCAVAGHSAAVPVVNQGRGEPTEILWAALVYFSTEPSARTLAVLVANYILEEIAEGRGFWFLDQAALLAMVAHSKSTPGCDVLLMPDRVLQCTDNPAPPNPVADEIDGCFWTVAASVPAHAGRIEHPAFRAYCD